MEAVASDFLDVAKVIGLGLLGCFALVVVYLLIALLQTPIIWTGMAVSAVGLVTVIGGFVLLDPSVVIVGLCIGGGGALVAGTVMLLFMDG